METKIKTMLTAILSVTMLMASGQQAEKQADVMHKSAALSEVQDGVYFTFNELKQNKPSISKEQLIKSYYDKADFTLSQWAATDNLFYLDAEGVKRKVSHDSLWGYVEEGTPFILLNGRFHKFSTVGSISVFTESYPTVQQTIAPVLTDVRSGTYLRLFDFASGQIGDYDVTNLTTVLAKDTALFNDYHDLKNMKTKRKKMYKYIERYNDKHELFPVK